MANFTRKAIMDSFLKLLNERPLSKITVKDIVSDCGINRNSFYYHFADLPALAEAVLEERLDKLLAEEQQYQSMEECLQSGIRMGLDHKRELAHIYRSASREVCEKYLNTLADHVVRQYVESITANKKISMEDQELIILYYKNQLSGFLLDWMQSDLRRDIEQDVHRICELFAGTMQTALDRAQKSFKSE